MRKVILTTIVLLGSLLSVNNIVLAGPLYTSGDPIPLSEAPGYPILGQGISGTIPGSITTAGAGVAAKFDVSKLGWYIENIEIYLFGPAAMGMGANPQSVHIGIANDAGGGLPESGFMSVEAEFELDGIDDEGLYSIPTSNLFLEPGSYWLVILPNTANEMDYTSVGWNQTPIPGLGKMAGTPDYGTTWFGNEEKSMTAFLIDGTHVPEPSQYVEIPAGWSMVSLPLITSSKALSDIFPGAIVAYGYEKNVGYKLVEELEAGKGYWLLVDKDQGYILTGEPFEMYNYTVDEDGWQMIGGCTYEALPFTENCDIEVIYGYEQGTGYQITESLMPGMGYWALFKEVTDFCEFTVMAIG